MTVRIGVDVGGTKTAAALVGDHGLVGPVVTLPTDTASATALISGIAGLIEQVAAAAPEPVATVGLGIAGLVDHDRGRVLFAPHLPLRDAPVAADLETATGFTVRLENDATAAAWGEYVLGAGQGAQSFLMVSVGTGLGGGIVMNGVLMRGAWGLAGEVGHVRFSDDGHPCACGATGCWEQYASGNALGRRAREAVIAEPGAGAAILAAAGGSIDGVDGHAVAHALDQNDVLARRLIAAVGHDLGEGLAGLVAVLDPEVVVVGGGVSAHGDLLIEPAQAAMAARLVGHAHRVVPTLRAASLGGDAALIGAALAVQTEAQ